MEAWTEVNLVPVRIQDEALVDLVGELVHEQLREDIATWFFFWEPQLRVRIRWRDGSRLADHRSRLVAVLDAWKAQGNIEDWYDGAHGVRGERYSGEADEYGEEVWPRLQESWMSGSELALTLIKLDAARRLPRPREYYWSRQVHLFTNQLLGTWEAEIEGCLRQALGYLKLSGAATPEATRLITELQTFG